MTGYYKLPDSDSAAIRAHPQPVCAGIVLPWSELESSLSVGFYFPSSIKKKEGVAAGIQGGLRSCSRLRMADGRMDGRIDGWMDGGAEQHHAVTLPFMCRHPLLLPLQCQQTLMLRPGCAPAFSPLQRQKIAQNNIYIYIYIIFFFQK